MENSSKYIGEELTLFDKANNWKTYWGNIVKPFLKGNVLEVGAGIGGTTLHLADGSQSEWICLEPDAELGVNLQEMISTGKLPEYCKYVNGTLQQIPAGKKFNAIIYIDVIEHIEKDADELLKAAEHLEKGGHLIILVPALQSLYSPYDKQIGHYRRYSKKRLLAAAPSSVKPLKITYLDSVGAMASFANRLFLKQSYPSLKQVLFWDNNLVKMSKTVDPLIRYALGRSCLMIAQKTTD